MVAVRHLVSATHAFDALEQFALDEGAPDDYCEYLNSSPKRLGTWLLRKAEEMEKADG